MKKEKEEKKILVANKIVEINIKKRTITLSWQFPSFFSTAHQEWVDSVFQKLLNQQVGGDIKITGLSLSFYEENETKKDKTNPKK